MFRMAVEQSRDYAMFLLDPQGHVMTWNVGAERVKGYSAAEIIGRHFSTFYTPDAVGRGWPQYELKIATIEGRFEDEGWRVKKDGGRFWANVVITALRDENGKLLGFSKITRDLTDRKRHEEALRQSEERFRLLVEGVEDYAIYMLDPLGVVSSWNTGARRILGHEADDIIGKHFSRFYAQEDIDAGKPWEELATARRRGSAEDEGWRVRKSGERFWARVVVSALTDSDGRLRGFAKVTQDLSDREHLRNLEMAAKNVNEFIATLAHELRNPLAPIRNAVQLMGRSSSATVHEAMRLTIDRQSAHLLRIVDDMIDVSRITRGVLDIAREPTDLADVIHRAVEAARPGIDAARHALEVELPPTALIVRGDVHRLVQILTNLLNNSARYTPEGGRISIEARAEGNLAVVSVRDTGRGIEHAMQERIFDMFVQGRTALERVGGGLGIGLALARKLAEAHNGTLEVDSAGEGKGSEFTLKVPLAHEASIEPAPAIQPRVQPVAGRRSQRVLVVDDNPDAATALGALLTSLGHETRIVHDGVRALEEAPAFRPDIVLLDIGMPGIDGFEVARRLRALRQEPEPRIVAVTGWGDEMDRQQSREAGFDLHLVKPVDADVLARVLAEKGVATLH